MRGQKEFIKSSGSRWTCHRDTREWQNHPDNILVWCWQSRRAHHQKGTSSEHGNTKNSLKESSGSRCTCHRDIRQRQNHPNNTTFWFDAGNPEGHRVLAKKKLGPKIRHPKCKSTLNSKNYRFTYILRTAQTEPKRTAVPESENQEPPRREI